MVLSFIFFSYISHSVAFLLVDNHSRVDLSSIRTSTTVLTSNNASLSVGSYEKESKRKIVNHLFTCSLFEYSKRQKKNRLSFSFFLSFFFFPSRFFFDTFGQCTRATTVESCTVQFLYVLLHY